MNKTFINKTKLIIAGSQEEIGLQHQILNVVVFTGGLLSGISLVVNYALGLHWGSVAIAFMSVLVCSFAYLHSRITKSSFHLRFSALLFLILIFTPAIWFFNGGTMGSFMYFVPLFVVTIYVANNGLTRFLFIALLLFVTTVLILLEYIYPDMVAQYANRDTRYIDLLLAFFLSFAGLLTYLNLSDKIFSESNKKLLFQNTRLQKHQEEILTQQKEIETQKKELEKKTKSLQEANATKDRFFSIIAHDLKTPFNSILGVSKLLVENKENIQDEETHLHIDIIESASQNAYKLLLNLLEWSRIQTNNISCKAEKIDLSFVINENIDLLQTQANNKSLRLFFESDDETYFAHADEYMTNAIVRNLISNALKFTKEGEIKILLQQQDLHCILSVIDSGIGMEQKTLDNLFTIDKSISTRGTNGESGTGLGLILCKEFVDKNNGHISVSSQINIGSTFTVKLPRSLL